MEPVSFEKEYPTRVPKRLFLAMAMSLCAWPLPLALSKGNFFHGFTIYDRHWWAFFFVYIFLTAVSVFLIGTAHMNIRDPERDCRGMGWVRLAYGLAFFSFFSMHILHLFFRGSFKYLESLL